MLGRSKPYHYLHRVAHAETFGDVPPYRGGRVRGQGEHRRVAEPLTRVAQPQIVRPEVVPPGRHAVCLVHHQQPGTDGGEPVRDVRLGQLLGSEEDHVDRGGADAGPCRLVVASALGGVDGGGAQRAGSEQTLHLVALKRDQRRHDHDRTAEQDRGHLVHGGLARAGRHDGEYVTPLHHGLHRAELGRAQLLPAEDPTGGAAQTTGRECEHGSP